MKAKAEIIETIADELIGVLPIHKGPFISSAEARRLAQHDNQKRYDVAEGIFNAITEPSKTVTDKEIIKHIEKDCRYPGAPDMPIMDEQAYFEGSKWMRSYTQPQGPSKVTDDDIRAASKEWEIKASAGMAGDYVNEDFIAGVQWLQSRSKEPSNTVPDIDKAVSEIIGDKLSDEDRIIPEHYVRVTFEWLRSQESAQDRYDKAKSTLKSYYKDPAIFNALCIAAGLETTKD